MKPLVCLAEFLFCEFVVGYVYIDANHSRRLTRFIHVNLPASSYPMNTPVRPDYAPFSVCRLSRLQRPVIQLDHSCPIVGVNQIFEGGLRSAKASRRQTVHRLQFRRPSIDSSSNIPFKSS